MTAFARKKDIRVAVVGYGGAFNMGRAHLNEARAAGMTPAAVCDPDTARLEVARTEFPGIATFESVTDMLRHADANLAVLITPHNTHAPIALECLRAGRHVVCEKPMAITTRECDAMIAAAARRKLLLSTYHNRHWDGCVREAVRQIRGRKAIGDVFRIECHMGGYGKPGDWWRSSKSISGGILYDWGVHLLEYALQLIDGEIAEVSGVARRGFWSAQTKWKADGNEDEATASVRFRGGQWLSLTITTLDANPKRGVLEITGTRGSYIMDHATYEILTPAAGGMRVFRGKNPASEGWRYYRNVADHLARGKPLVITPEWSRRPIHILDLANRSAETGRAIPARYA